MLSQSDHQQQEQFQFLIGKRQDQKGIEYLLLNKKKEGNQIVWEDQNSPIIQDLITKFEGFFNYLVYHEKIFTHSSQNHLRIIATNKRLEITRPQSNLSQNFYISINRFKKEKPRKRSYGQAKILKIITDNYEIEHLESTIIIQDRKQQKIEILELNELYQNLTNKSSNNKQVQADLILEYLQLNNAYLLFLCRDLHDNAEYNYPLALMKKHYNNLLMSYFDLALE